MAASMGSDSAIPAGLEVLELSVAQQFEIERFNRAIEATADADALRSLAKQLLQAWHTQQAATNWMIQQQAPAGGADG
jgi:hypothetical protein